MPASPTSAPADSQVAERWLRLSRAVRELGREPRTVDRLQRATVLTAATTNAHSAALVPARPAADDGSVHWSTSDPGELAELRSVLVAHRLLADDAAPGAAGGGGQPGEGQPDAGRFRTAPVEVHDEHVATLCVLAPAGRAFDRHDLALLAGLADQIGTSVEAARASESVASQQAWLAASAEILTLLLSAPDDAPTVTQHIVDHVHRLSDARTVTFAGPAELSDTSFEVRLAAGVDSGRLVGRTFAKAGTITGLALQTNAGQLRGADEWYCHHADLAPSEPLGSVIAVPLSGGDGLRGAIVASRLASQPPFTPVDLALVEDFARQSSLALQLSDNRAAKDQLHFREQREAADRRLQDEVIQRLFSLGSTILAYTGGDADGTRDWPHVLEGIDETIAQLRTSLTAGPVPG